MRTMDLHLSKVAVCILVILVSWCFASLAGDTDAKIVKNGKEPGGNAYTLRLVENLRVGPDEDDDRFIWTAVNTALQVDERGRIFVVDPKENRIVVLDENGAFLKQIGQKGQGPGEFQALASFQLLADGTGVAFENRGAVSTFSYFDRNGNYREQDSHNDTQLILQSVSFSPDGSLMGVLAAKLYPENSKLAIRSALLDRTKTLKKEIVQYDLPLPNPQRMNDPEYWVDYISERIKITSKGLTGFTAFDKHNHVYTAVANKYEVTKWDADMNKLLVFTRDYEPIPLTDEEIHAVIQPITDMLTSLPPQLQSVITKNVIARAIEKAEFPPVKMPVSGLTVTDDGPERSTTRPNASKASLDSSTRSASLSATASVSGTSNGCLTRLRSSKLDLSFS